MTTTRSTSTPNSNNNTNNNGDSNSSNNQSNNVRPPTRSGTSGAAAAATTTTAAASASQQYHHPGTSGRSPPPPRGGMVAGVGVGGSSGGGGGGGGRPSLGGSSVGGGGASDGRSSVGVGGGRGQRLSYDSSFTSDFPIHHHATSTATNAANTTVGSSSATNTNRLWNTGRLSGVSTSSGRLRGTRLSYGATSTATPSSASGQTPISFNNNNNNNNVGNINHHEDTFDGSNNNIESIASPESNSSTTNNVNTQSAFFAALSPSTAQFLRTSRTAGKDCGGGVDNTTTTTSSASVAAASALRMAGNAARGIDDHHPLPNRGVRGEHQRSNDVDINGADENNDDDDDDANNNNTVGDKRNDDGTNDNKGNNNDNSDDDDQHANNEILQMQQQQQQKQQQSHYLTQIGQDDETTQLRSLVQSLLGMQLPATPTPTTAASVPLMPTTPDPTTASFYALALLAKTNGRRPDDAYLAARAMALKGEGRRAIWILDRAGLIGAGIGGGVGNVDVDVDVAVQDNGGEKLVWNNGGDDGEGDVGGGVGDFGDSFLGGDKVDNDNYEEGSSFLEDTPTTLRHNDGNVLSNIPAVSNEQGICNALLLRAESALLAGQCLVQAGEYERAIAVYEEAMRFPPPPPPLDWGLYGYGYRMENNVRDGSGQTGAGGKEKEEGDDNDGDDDDDEEQVDLADEMYIRQWREEALSHTALIDEGNDERLLRLAENIKPLPFTSSTTINVMMEGIHPMARLCSARGVAYDELSNPHRAIPFLRMALAIDARCIEAFDYVIRRRLLTPDEEREWVASLNWGAGGEKELGLLGISWLKDAYISRLRRGMGSAASSSSREQEHSRDEKTHHDNILDASPVHRVGLQTPSMLSLGSPDFAGGRGKKRSGSNTEQYAESHDAIKPVNESSPSHTVDDAFRKLATRHRLGKSSDVLSHAAIRAYASHDLRSALTYCTVIDSLDPFCRTAGYVHVATLVGLGLKRRLFQLAHRLVDADPKDALAWFAVGSYYFLCCRYDLAQRHFSRSTRLDPSSAECWIGFGCSFAVCDESDQALASFRAAQNKFAGSHIPLLYMGMEYLRTNHLSLAGHFLTSAQKTDASDPLCCNELGVWSYRRGDMTDAAFWFVKALRLHVETESSALTSTDEALGMNGYILLNSQGTGGYPALSNSNGKSAIGPSKPTDPFSPEVKRRSSDEEPPVSTILCAVKTPSGQSIAASMMSATFDSSLTDIECIERCRDQFWEPTIFNLGQSYRKMKQWSNAIICFEKCSSLNPGSSAAYAALGFARHLSGDVDGAIDSYHEALSRKPDDPFSSEMLNRALAEAVTYPKSSIFASLESSPLAQGQRSSIGSSILTGLGKAQNQAMAMPEGNNNHSLHDHGFDESMITTSTA